MNKLKGMFVAQTVLTNFIILGLGFCSSILMARLLGPTGRGEVAAAMLWPVTLSYLGSFGIPEAVTYFAAHSSIRTGTVLTNAFLITLAQTAIIIPLGYFFMPFLLAKQTANVILASQFYLINIPIGLLALNGTNIILGKLYMQQYNVLQLVVPAGMIIIAIVLAFFDGLTLQTILIAYTLLHLLLLVVVIAVLLHMRLWNTLAVDISLIKKMFEYGMRVFFGAISQMANLRLDQMLIAARLPAFELGIYIIALSAANITRAVPAAFRTVLTPSVATVNDEDRDVDLLQARLHKYWLINAFFGIALLPILPLFIPLLFGSEFQGSIIPACILILASVLLGGKEILTGAVNGLGTPAIVSQAEVIGLFVTVFGLLLLLPLLGVLGAALVTLFSYASSLIFLSSRMSSIHHISPRIIFLPVRNDVKILVNTMSQGCGYLRVRLLLRYRGSDA